MSGEFALQLDAFVKKAGKRANEVVGKIVTDVVTAVDERSPVGNMDTWESLHPRSDIKTQKTTRWKGPAGYVGGRFRANWNLSIGAPDLSTTLATDADGERTVEANLGVIPEDAAGKVYYLSNSLPYAMPLEFGWSKKAPNGIVRLTAAEFQGFVDKAVATAQRAVP